MTLALPAPGPADGWRRLATLYLPYAVLIAVAVGLGLYERLGTYAFAATMAAITVALTLAVFRDPALAALARHLGPYGLGLFHVWRIPAAIVFFAYGLAGLLPPVFVLLAGFGDLVAGLFALALTRLPQSRAWLSAFHLFGFADFCLALSTGLALTILAVPEMATIATLPVALIPLVGVPLSGATHLAALAQLRRR
jgi:hypothetical protein